MRKNLIYLCMFVFALGVFNGCGDDDEAKDHLVGRWELKSDAMDMTWESSEEITISGISMSTTAVAVLATQYGNSTLPEKLKSITFNENNKLEASYIEGGVEKTAVYGTYRVVNDYKINFTPDVEKLLGDVKEISSEAMAAIKLLLAAGIPIYYYLPDPTNGHFYLDTKTIKEIKNILPLIAASMSGDDASDLIIKNLLEQMPGILDKTEKIEVGLNFTKATYQATN